jgi:hypothetical protein
MSATTMYAAKAMAVLMYFMAGCSRKPPERWTPPGHPSPQAILNEAREDAYAKRHEDALAKHVWYHENALKIAPAQYGVRLSFALSAWVELGKSYPPALEKLKSIRDKNELSIRESESSEENFQTFHDLAAISEALGDDSKTTELFFWLDQNKPDFAKSVYPVAEPFLIRAKKFALCGKHLEAEVSFKRMLELYNLHKQTGEASLSKVKRLEFGRNRFANDAATLVALLTMNGRNDEAAKIAAAAERELDDPEFKAVLNRAKNGEVPEPWP